MEAREFEEALGVTAEELDRWSAPYEHGDWPDGTTVYSACGWDEFYDLAEQHGVELPPRNPTLPTSA